LSPPAHASRPGFPLGAALLAALACFDGVAAQEWSTEREFLLTGPAGAGSYWGAISGVAVGHGSIYVLDRQERRLCAIDDEGHVVWTTGRAGAGPGEFSSVTMAVVLTGAGELAVPDLGNARIAVFDTTGRFERSHPFATRGGSPIEWLALGDRIVYALHPFPSPVLTASAPGSSDMTTRRYMKRSLSGADEDTLLRTPFSPPMSVAPDGSMILRMGAPPPAAASDGNSLYVAAPDRYEIGVFDIDGKRTGTIRRDVKAVAVPAERRASLERQAEELEREMTRQTGRRVRITFEYPSHLPAVTHLVAGQGWLLVRRGDTAAADRKWICDIFRNGDYVGFMALPQGVTVKAVTAARIIAVEQDENDVPALLVLSFKPPARR